MTADARNEDDLSSDGPEADATGVGAASSTDDGERKITSPYSDKHPPRPRKQGKKR